MASLTLMNASTPWVSATSLEAAPPPTLALADIVRSTGAPVLPRLLPRERASFRAFETGRGAAVAADEAFDEATLVVDLCFVFGAALRLRGGAFVTPLLRWARALARFFARGDTGSLNCDSSERVMSDICGTGRRVEGSVGTAHELCFRNHEVREEARGGEGRVNLGNLQPPTPSPFSHVPSTSF